MQKLLAFFAVRDGCDREVGMALAAAASRVAAAPGIEGVAVLLAESDDPLPALYRMRRYEAVLEVRSLDAESLDTLIERLAELRSDLGDCVHSDLSALVVAEENRVVPAEPPGTRYMSLMRRKAGTGHDDYISYYRNEHARFGIECPGATGYHQNYVDLKRSREAAARGGFGIWDVDSVTEIFVPSARVFEDATSDDPIREEAAIDEARFIDRGTQAGFCVHVAGHFPE
ncbi:MAG: EthD domain-containing protein [bacterium]|nr:hypothetical protein [Deltaproteobacteria bacterium]MCP4906011.1 EthD domain-containing protein [bacterium]